MVRCLPRGRPSSGTRWCGIDSRRDPSGALRSERSRNGRSSGCAGTENRAPGCVLQPSLAKKLHAIEQGFPNERFVDSLKRLASAQKADDTDVERIVQDRGQSVDGDCAAAAVAKAGPVQLFAKRFEVQEPVA